MRATTRVAPTGRCRSVGDGLVPSREAPANNMRATARPSGALGSPLRVTQYRRGNRGRRFVAGDVDEAPSFAIRHIRARTPIQQQD